MPDALSSMSSRTKGLLSRLLRAVPVVVVAVITGGCGDDANPTESGPPSQSVTSLWAAPLSTGHSLAADETSLYVASSGEPVYVLSRQTGASVRTLANAGFTSRGGLHAAGGMLLVSGFQMRMLNAATGAVQWQYNASRAADVPLLVNDSLALVVSNGGNTTQLHAVRLTDGTAKWVTDIRPPTLTLAPGALLIASGAALQGSTCAVTFYIAQSQSVQASFVVVFDVANGAQRWSAMISATGAVSGAPAIGDNLVIVTDGAGKSVGYNSATGAMLWASPPLAGGSGAVSPYFGTSILVGAFAVTSEGLVGMSGMEVATGRKWWNAVDLSASVSPVFALRENGQLVATNLAGELLGLDVSQNLRIRWRVSFGVVDRPKAIAIRGDTIFVNSAFGLRAFIVSP